VVTSHGLGEADDGALGGGVGHRGMAPRSPAAEAGLRLQKSLGKNRSDRHVRRL
jgi:hypothetical protein